jgi:hypothetical protein
VARPSPPPEITAALPRLVAAAQAQYDAWQQDEEGLDPELGTGGICHLIAEQMASELGGRGVMCTTVSAWDEVHVYVVAQIPEGPGRGVWSIDIRPHVYERGGGYSWRKIPEVTFERGDVVIDRLSTDPEDFGEYVDDT